MPRHPVYWLILAVFVFVALLSPAAAAIPDNLQQVAARPYDSAGNAIENTEFTALAASSGTTTTRTSSDVLNTRGRGVSCVLDLVSTAGGTVSPAIDGKDTLSGNYYDILLANVPQATTGFVRFTVYPAAVVASAQVGIAATANIAVNDVLPRYFRVRGVVGTASSANYQVGCSFVGAS